MYVLHYRKKNGNMINNTNTFKNHPNAARNNNRKEIQVAKLLKVKSNLWVWMACCRRYGVHSIASAYIKIKNVVRVIEQLFVISDNQQRQLNLCHCRTYKYLARLKKNERNLFLHYLVFGGWKIPLASHTPSI